MAFDKEALDGIRAEAKRLGVEWQALASVAAVESDGRPLWDGLCPIRIEGHYFYKQLSGKKREAAVNQGLASQRAGAVRNPRKMAARYAMLEKMKAIDENAAIESCSWGLGQVMGIHWEDLGYSSPKALAKEAQSSVSGQVRLMGRFIEKNCFEPLKAKNWASFARFYNGPNYRVNRYDTKMANAYETFLHGSVRDVKTVTKSDDIVERGDKGAEVQELQEDLAKLGYYVGYIDGIFGGATELAVMDFQKDAGIVIDGRAGGITKSKLKAWTRAKKKKKGDMKMERADVVYTNQRAIRNRPVTANLELTLSTAVYDVYGPGHEAQIYSGGQARKGTPGPRTGSVRHDDYGKGGRALDAYIVKKGGKRLAGTELGKLGQYWLASKYGGCGLEMAIGGIHLDEWKTPPRGGGMHWTYAYLDRQPWGAEVKQMLMDGRGGKKPPLFNSK